MSVSLVGARSSSHFTVYPPKLDVLKHDSLGFSQSILSFQQQAYEFEDEASLLGDDYSTESESDFEQDDFVDSDISMESDGVNEDMTAFEQEAAAAAEAERLSQERVQFDEMARAHSLAKTPNMTEARLNQVTNKLWKKYLASK